MVTCVWPSASLKRLCDLFKPGSILVIKFVKRTKVLCELGQTGFPRSSHRTDASFTAGPQRNARRCSFSHCHWTSFKDKKVSPPE